MGDIPEGIRAVYKTALEISPEHHLLMASEIQKAVDESISKTVNMPANSSVQDVLDIYQQAHELGLKGISIFRTNSRSMQRRELAIL